MPDAEIPRLVVVQQSSNMSIENPYESPTAVDPKREQAPVALSKSRWHIALISISAGVGFVAGWALWHHSLGIFGRQEPWDGNYWAYCLSLFAVGTVTAALCPRRVWIPLLAIYLGQVSFLQFEQPQGPIIMPAFFSVALFGMFPAVIGAAVVWLLGLFVRQ